MIKKLVWLSLPLLLVTGLVLYLKADESVSLENIPLKDTKTITKVLHFIHDNYVDPTSIDPFRMIKLASKELQRNIAPLTIKENNNTIEASLGEKKLRIPIPSSASIEDIAYPLGRILGFVDTYYHGRLEEDDRLSLAMTGVMDTLDPHSNYLPSKVYNEFKIGTKGNFGGLGIVIGIRDGDLTVIAPLEGTPAFEAGVKSKDKIVQIGEESTVNMGLTEAVEKLRGPIGSKVSVTLTRSGLATPLKLELTRALIHIKSVAGKVLTDKITNKSFALLKVKNFQEDTLDQFKKTLRSFQSGNTKLSGLILDLRNNPGGLLDQAIDIGDYFLKEGVIVKTVGAHGEPLEVEEAKPGQEGENIPMVVLINEGSASASEIVSGALQMNDRAVVIGNRSFGKGSVQTVYDLKDGAALKLTIANYLTAKDYKVQSIGINPDVGLNPAIIDEKMIDIYENIKKREIDLKEASEERENKAPDLPPPPIQMTYLSSEKKLDEESTGQIDVQDDFPVHLAEKILELPESQSRDRQIVMKALPSLITSMKKEEAGKIKESMTRIGVDWSTGEKEGHPAGTVIFEILDDKEQPRTTLSAGESGSLRITVENKGNAPYYQLIGVTQSEDPLFANLEFPFGKLAPHEKKQWKTPLRIPDFTYRRSIPVTISFHELYDRNPKPSSFAMQLEEPTQPLFQYSYGIIDDGTHGTSGNGNHIAERGETIGLDVKVKNFGKGESHSPIINLKNLDGEEAFIEKGRVELSALKPGGESEGVLIVRVPKKGKSQKLSFDLVILDNHAGKDLMDRIEIPLGENGVAQITPAPGTLQSPPVIDTTPDQPLLVAQGSSYHLKGHASDDHELKHLFILVGDEKVFYKSGGNGTSLSFDTKLPLKKGINLITLAAQDDRELTTRKQWIVWRDK